MSAPETSTSSSITQVEPFNSQARQAFHIMLEGRKDQARERVTAFEKHKYIQWLTESPPELVSSGDNLAKATSNNERSSPRTLFGTPNPSTPPNSRPEGGLAVDPDLLSPRFDKFQIESGPIDPIRQQVRTAQTYANMLAKRKHGKQRQITTYDIGDKVSVAVPALDRASTDDKRIFGRVIDVIEEYDSYRILTKHGLLDRNYPISELNPLPKHIDLGISNPPPTKWVTLRYCAAQESTTEKVPVHCGCKDQKTWCSTRRCACFKAEAKCSIACHGGRDQDNTPDCPNISTMVMRTQRGHRVRDQDQEKKEAKRQRRNTAGRWVASKGNDLVDSSKGKKK